MTPRTARATRPGCSRTAATRDTTLGGAAVRAGQKVLVWEASANRDAAAFAEADGFDLRRSPNPHLAFGSGVHFCLGANLARLEIRLLLDELLTRYPHLQRVGAPEWARSNRHTGMRRLELRGRSFQP